MSSSNGEGLGRGDGDQINKRPKQINKRPKQIGRISKPCALENADGSHVQDWKVWAPNRTDTKYRITEWHAKERDVHPYKQLDGAEWEIKYNLVKQAQIQRYVDINFQKDNSIVGAAKYSFIHVKEAAKYFPDFVWVGDETWIDGVGHGGPVQMVLPKAKKSYFDDVDETIKGEYEWKSASSPFTFNTREDSFDRWTDCVNNADLNKIAPHTHYPLGKQHNAWMNAARRTPSILVMPMQTWKWDEGLDCNVPIDFEAKGDYTRPTDKELEDIKKQINEFINEEYFYKAYILRNFGDDNALREYLTPATNVSSDGAEGEGGEDGDEDGEQNMPSRREIANLKTRLMVEAQKVVPRLNEWGFMLIGGDTTGVLSNTSKPGENVSDGAGVYNIGPKNTLTGATKRWNAWRKTDIKKVPNTASFDVLIGHPLPDEVAPVVSENKQAEYDNLELTHPYFMKAQMYDDFRGKREFQIKALNKKLKGLQNPPDGTTVDSLSVTETIGNIDSLKAEGIKKTAEEGEDLAILYGQWQQEIQDAKATDNEKYKYLIRRQNEILTNTMTDRARQQFYRRKWTTNMGKIQGRGKRLLQEDEAIMYIRGEGQYDGMKNEDMLKAKERYTKNWTADRSSRFMELLDLNPAERNEKRSMTKREATAERKSTAYWTVDFMDKMKKDDDYRDKFERKIKTIDDLQADLEAKLLQIKDTTNEDDYANSIIILKRRYVEKIDTLRVYTHYAPTFKGLRVLLRSYTSEDSGEAKRLELYNEIWGTVEKITNAQIDGTTLRNIYKMFMKYAKAALGKLFYREFTKYIKIHHTSEEDEADNKAKEKIAEDQKKYNMMSYSEMEAFDMEVQRTDIERVGSVLERLKDAILTELSLTEEDPSDNELDQVLKNLIKKTNVDGFTINACIREKRRIIEYYNSRIDAAKVKHGLLDKDVGSGGNGGIGDIQITQRKHSEEKYAIYMEILSDQRSNIDESYINLLKIKRAKDVERKLRKAKIALLQAQVKSVKHIHGYNSELYNEATLALSTAVDANTRVITTEEYPYRAEQCILAVVGAAQAFQEAMDNISKLIDMQDDSAGVRRNHTLIDARNANDAKIVDAIGRLNNILNPSMSVSLGNMADVQLESLVGTFGPATVSPQAGGKRRITYEILHPSLQKIYTNLEKKKQHARIEKENAAKEKLEARARQTKMLDDEVYDRKEQAALNEEEQALDEAGKFDIDMVWTVGRRNAANGLHGPLTDDGLLRMFNDEWDLADEELDTGQQSKLDDMAHTILKSIAEKSMGVPGVDTWQEWMGNRKVEFEDWNEKRVKSSEGKVKPLAVNMHNILNFVISVWGKNDQYRGPERERYLVIKSNQAGGGSRKGWTGPLETTDSVAYYTWDTHQYARDGDDIIYEDPTTKKRVYKGEDGMYPDDAVGRKNRLIKLNKNHHIPEDLRVKWKKIEQEDRYSLNFDNWVEPDKSNYTNASGQFTTSGLEFEFNALTALFAEVLLYANTHFGDGFAVHEFNDGKLETYIADGFCKLDNDIVKLTEYRQEWKTDDEKSAKYVEFIDYVQGHILKMGMQEFQDTEEDDDGDEDGGEEGDVNLPIHEPMELDDMGNGNDGGDDEDSDGDQMRPRMEGYESTETQSDDVVSDASNSDDDGEEEDAPGNKSDDDGDDGEEEDAPENKSDDDGDDGEEEDAPENKSDDSSSDGSNSDEEDDDDDDKEEDDEIEGEEEDDDSSSDDTRSNSDDEEKEGAVVLEKNHNNKRPGYGAPYMMAAAKSFPTLLCGDASSTSTVAIGKSSGQLGKEWWGSCISTTNWWER